MCKTDDTNMNQIILALRGSEYRSISIDTIIVTSKKTGGFKIKTLLNGMQVSYMTAKTVSGVSIKLNKIRENFAILIGFVSNPTQEEKLYKLVKSHNVAPLLKDGKKVIGSVDMTNSALAGIANSMPSKGEHISYFNDITEAKLMDLVQFIQGKLPKSSTYGSNSDIHTMLACMNIDNQIKEELSKPVDERDMDVVAALYSKRNTNNTVLTEVEAQVILTGLCAKIVRTLVRNVYQNMDVENSDYTLVAQRIMAYLELLIFARNNTTLDGMILDLQSAAEAFTGEETYEFLHWIYPNNIQTLEDGRIWCDFQMMMFGTLSNPMKNVKDAYHAIFHKGLKGLGSIATNISGPIEKFTRAMLAATEATANTVFNVLSRDSKHVLLQAIMSSVVDGKDGYVRFVLKDKAEMHFRTWNDAYNFIGMLPTYADLDGVNESSIVNDLEMELIYQVDADSKLDLTNMTAPIILYVPLNHIRKDSTSYIKHGVVTNILKSQRFIAMMEQFFGGVGETYKITDLLHMTSHISNMTHTKNINSNNIENTLMGEYAKGSLVLSGVITYGTETIDMKYLGEKYTNVFRYMTTGIEYTDLAYDLASTIVCGIPFNSLSEEDSRTAHDFVGMLSYINPKRFRAFVSTSHEDNAELLSYWYGVGDKAYELIKSNHNYWNAGVSTGINVHNAVQELVLAGEYRKVNSFADLYIGAEAPAFADPELTKVARDLLSKGLNRLGEEENVVKAIAKIHSLFPTDDKHLDGQGLCITDSSKGDEMIFVNDRIEFMSTLLKGVSSVHGFGLKATLLYGDIQDPKLLEKITNVVGCAVKAQAFIDDMIVALQYNNVVVTGNSTIFKNKTGAQPLEALMGKTDSYASLGYNLLDVAVTSDKHKLNYEVRLGNGARSYTSQPVMDSLTRSMVFRKVGVYAKVGVNQILAAAHHDQSHVIKIRQSVFDELNGTFRKAYGMSMTNDTAILQLIAYPKRFLDRMMSFEVFADDELFAGIMFPSWFMCLVDRDFDGDNMGVNVLLKLGTDLEPGFVGDSEETPTIRFENGNDVDVLTANYDAVVAKHLSLQKHSVCAIYDTIIKAATKHHSANDINAMYNIVEGYRNMSVDSFLAVDLDDKITDLPNFFPMIMNELEGLSGYKGMMPLVPTTKIEENLIIGMLIHKRWLARTVGGGVNVVGSFYKAACQITHQASPLFYAEPLIANQNEMIIKGEKKAINYNKALFAAMVELTVQTRGTENIIRLKRDAILEMTLEGYSEEEAIQSFVRIPDVRFDLMKEFTAKVCELRYIYRESANGGVVADGMISMAIDKINKIYNGTTKNNNIVAKSYAQLKYEEDRQKPYVKAVDPEVYVDVN